MQQRYSIAITEAAGVSSAVLARLLPGLHASAKVQVLPFLNENSTILPDLLIASCTEAEDARRFMAAGHGALLLVGDSREASDLQAWAVANGIFCCERDNLSICFPLLLASFNQLHSMHARETSLQRKLSDTKLVNRAKLLLMTRLQMSEEEAHRYIEKTAMDNAESRREIALRLIRTYEE